MHESHDVKLKAHGMREEIVQKVFQAKSFRIQYCSPAWWGFADSTDRAQLEAFVRKAKKSKSAQTTSFPLNPSVKPQIRNYLQELSPSQRETGKTKRIMF